MSLVPSGGFSFDPVAVGNFYDKYKHHFENMGKSRKAQLKKYQDYAKKELARGRARRASKSSSRSSGRRKPPGATAQGAKAGTRDGNKRASYIKRGSRKRVKTGKKLPKISGKFRRKVQEALAGESYKGRYEVYKENTVYNPTVNTILWWDGHDAAYDRLLFSSPTQILDAASVLWNQKAADVDWSNLTGNLPYKDLKFPVKRLDFAMEMCNNTQRPMKIEVYECTPPMSDTITRSPLSDWSACLNNEAGTTFPNIASEVLTDTTFGGYTTKPGPRPEYHAYWNSRWKHTKSYYVLEPGQTAEHVMKTGAFQFDGNKFSQSGGVLAIAFPKVSHHIFVRVEAQTTFGATSGHSGIDANYAAASGFNLHIKTRARYFLSMPEAVFNIDPAVAGGAVIATNKHDSYRFLNNWDLTLHETQGQMEVENPVTAEGTGPVITTYTT